MTSGTNSAEEHSTRREIVNLLRTTGSLTVAELGERLGITHVAVRRHLTALERDGLVGSVQERQPMGRPTRVYNLTDAAEDLFPKKYGALSVEILDFLATLDPEQGLVNQFFARRGADLVNRYGPHVTEGQTLAERVARLTEVQTANGYLADWEAAGDAGTFVLKEFNCPVHAVSRKYPHACHHELEFFKSVLSTNEVERVECIAKGGTCCRYLIKDPAAGPAAE